MKRTFQAALLGLALSAAGCGAVPQRCGGHCECAATHAPIRCPGEWACVSGTCEYQCRAQCAQLPYTCASGEECDGRVCSVRKGC